MDKRHMYTTLPGSLSVVNPKDIAGAKRMTERMMRPYVLHFPERFPELHKQLPAIRALFND